jgi:hypothetical protein
VVLGIFVRAPEKIGFFQRKASRDTLKFKISKTTREAYLRLHLSIGTYQKYLNPSGDPVPFNV